MSEQIKFFVAVGLGLACGVIIHQNFTDPGLMKGTEASSVTVQVQDTTKSPASGMMGIIYADMGDQKGAEKAVTIKRDGTWSLMEKTEPGQFAKSIANGKVDDKGNLLDFPSSAFKGAKAIWGNGIGPDQVSLEVNGKVVPYGRDYAGRS